MRLTRLVAPRAGAWIETSRGGLSISIAAWPVAPRAGAWIETLYGSAVSGLNGRSPCGSVDRNIPKAWIHTGPSVRRSPCGGVDRNHRS